MKFISADPISIAEPLSDAPVIEAELSRLMELGSRIGLYGMLVGVLLWAWLVFPALGLPPFPLAGAAGTAGLVVSGLCWAVVVVVVCTVGHELLHLLALPGRLTRADTYLVFWRRNPAWLSTLFVKIGGEKSKWQFIWISTFPFIVLTLIPFLLAAFNENKPPLIVGIVAACNIYSSSVDLLQSMVLAAKAPGDVVLK